MRKALPGVFAALLICVLPAAVAAHPCPSEDGRITADDAALAGGAGGCPSPTESSKVCVGERLCRAQDGFRYPINGQCPPGSVLVPITSIPEACEAAYNVTPNPNFCPAGCQDGGLSISRARGDGCCTVTVTRICSQPAGN